MRLDGLFLTALLLLAPVPGAPAQELMERGTFKGYRFRVDLAAFNPDGKLLAAGGGDTRGGDLKLWDVATGKEIASLPQYTNSLYSLAFSADAKRLASGSQEAVQVWDVNTHKQLISFKVHGPGASDVALNRDGTRVAAVCWKQAHLWDVASGKELASFPHHVPISGMLGAAFSGDLATLAAHNYQSSYSRLPAGMDVQGVGPLVVGLIADVTGNIRYAFLFLVLIVWAAVPVLLAVDVVAGRADAQAYVAGAAR